MGTDWGSGKSYVYDDEIKYIPKRIIVKKDALWSVDFIWVKPEALNKRIKKMEINKEVMHKLMDDLSNEKSVMPPVIFFDIDKGKMEIKGGRHKIKVSKSMKISLIPLLIYNMKNGKPINPVDIKPNQRYWKYVYFGKYKMDSPENILSPELVEEWKSKPELITMKQLMADSKWQELRESLVGKWKNSPEKNIKKLRKYMDSMDDIVKVYRVYTYLNSNGFKDGKLNCTGLTKLLKEIEGRMR